MADQAILEWSCTKLRSAISDEATSFTVDLQEMLDMLVDIQAVTMPDDSFKSEELAKNARTAEEWAQNVRTAAYGVSDLVDELKMQPARTPPAAGKTTKRMDLPENKMKEIKQKLDGLLKESIEFNVVDARIIASNPTITVPPDAIVGRDEDREKIFDCLYARCRSEGPIIHLISGEKGVGKTTVAEMVFKDTRFRWYSRVWVNMSFELHEIGKSIISQLSGNEEMRHASEDNMDAITDCLHELLNGMKKVLVVLDNLFMDYGEWEPLKRMFTVGGDKDNQVIVIATTTQTRTADSVIQLSNLDPLSDDMCCTIIKQLAGHSEDRSTKMDLERLAPEIAVLCKGLPLAAQLFGRLLKFKDYEEWPTLLDKGRWSTYKPVDLSLELIYRTMPPNLRLCLAYCAILMFPSIAKEDLINQWIALGLIETSDGTISAIKLAEEYIVRLLDVSFLQTANLPQASGKYDTGPILFKMHDSMRDFGLQVIDADLGVLFDNDDDDCNVTENCRYVLIDQSDAWPSKSLLPNCKISAIICMLCSEMEVNVDSFSIPSCLRVLNLQRTPIQKLPHSISELEQLGYLNLSGCCRLTHLPQKNRDLRKLLHINLSGCSELTNLPDSFGKLINLVHINLSGCCALKDLQKKIGQLTNLMHLNLSGCSGLVTLPRSIGKLIKLVHLNLCNCSRLEELPPSFGKLQSLVDINLSGCTGLKTLPESFGDLRNLLHMDLSRCHGLSKLPKTFGRLISLEYISLSGCSGLETLPESFGDLRNLLHIDLSCCYRLSKLPESFRNLRKLVYLDLSFWSCFEGIKTALSGLNSLQHLNLSHPCCYNADHIHLKELKEVFGKLRRLQYLNLSMFLNPISYSHTEEQNSTYIECLRGLYSLEHLDLSHNIFLRDLPERLSGLNMLHTLDLSGCIRLKKLGKWMTEMHSLKSVVLMDCEGLESYQFEVGVDNNINNYVQLEDVTSQKLEITCLDRVKLLAEAQRINLKEKQKLRELKLCWTVNSEPESVAGNKPDRSVKESEPEGSVQGNKSDRSIEENKPNRSVEENEPEVPVQENKPDRSVEEIEIEVTAEKNGADRSVAEIEREVSVEEIETEVSVEKNAADRSAEEEIEAEVSVEKNGADRSGVEEIECEVSVEKNGADRSVEVTYSSCVEENDLLGKLEPPQNLQCLEIHGYSGKTCRPAWWSEKKCEHLLNLVKVTMEDFPRCETLPPFGLLPNLQQLVVRRMASITRINARDLIGSNKPAVSGLKCTIDDMLGLEEFNTTYHRGETTFTVSTFAELALHKCPCLRFGTLQPRAQRLVISECDTSLGEKHQGGLEEQGPSSQVISECDPSFGEKHQGRLEEEGPSSQVISECDPSSGEKHQGGLKEEGPVTQLVVKNCSKPINEWSLFDHLSILPSLTIEDCSLDALLQISDYDHSNSQPEYLGRLTSLHELKIVSCRDTGHLWGHIQKLTSLKSLHLSGFQSSQELPEELGNLTSLRELHLSDWPNLKEIPKDFGNLTSLEKLAIVRCPKINSLPDSISNVDLQIKDSPNLNRWHERKDNKKLLGHVRTKI